MKCWILVNEIGNLFGRIDYVRSTLDKENVQQINLFWEMEKPLTTHQPFSICIMWQNSINPQKQKQKLQKFENLFENQTVIALLGYVQCPTAAEYLVFNT